MSYFSRTEKKLQVFLLIPVVVVVLGVVIYPLLYTLWLSFNNVDLTHPLENGFVGVKNYFYLLKQDYFWGALGRTFYFTVVSLLIEITAGILLALLLNADFAGRNILRVLIILPWALPTIVNGALWRWIFNPEYGALNALLVKLGIINTYQSWLGKPFLALNMVIIADAWKMTPLVAILLLAALQAIPRDLYEACEVDGANKWTIFREVILPYLKPTLLVVIVLRTMEAFKVFDIIYIMTRGGPANGTQVITYYAYQEAFSFLHLSKGAALSYLISLIILALAIIYSRLIKNEL
ncbi:carbohydrate ABC transporter permease [Carboxydothermus pertinax]|uniref:ABC transporter permease n=1 Tax=Carboxydothermus pertinax TaxID=870242 RepID=A0A1L8CWS2_9THEO|nr:sugar ABC transporter permease [Carboxydothermus pertinax]GAV23319.1 ABC transporter permease [Carboxydothermus pertinax]